MTKKQKNPLLAFNTQINNLITANFGNSKGVTETIRKEDL